LWSLSLPEKKIELFDAVRSAANIPINPTISPDGRWVAYQTNLGRRLTIYVQPIPPNGSAYELLPRGADLPHEPVWSRRHQLERRAEAARTHALTSARELRRTEAPSFGALSRGYRLDGRVIT
jgi:hypothetical protein